MLQEIRPDHTVINHESLTFRQAQKIVGGFIEPLNYQGYVMMLVNKDGGKEPNRTATRIYGGAAVTLIYGTVIVGPTEEIYKMLNS